MVLVASSALAEPVEVRQGTPVGAGYSFRRGGACLVITARHVVSQMGEAIAVLDRTGAQSQGNRAYDNESYDLALINVPEKSTLACSSVWPDAAWLARATFSAQSDFQAVRHYPNGRETLVRLRHAGGVRHLLTMAPADRLTIRESDSGSIVQLDGRLVGIVQSVDVATDRVNVLRFDTIDQLIGDRFRNKSASGPLSYAGVFSRGRVDPEWSAAIQSWLTEKAGRTIVQSGANREPGAALCEVKVEVLAWERVSVPNPDFDAVQLQLQACGKKNFLLEQTCQAGRAAAKTTPRRVLSQKLTVRTSISPPESPGQAKLQTTTHLPPSGERAGRTELELTVLQAAVGPVLQELLGSTSCP